MNIETLFLIVIILSIFFYYVMMYDTNKRENFTLFKNIKIQNNTKRHNNRRGKDNNEGFQNQPLNNNLLNNNDKAELILFYSKTCPYSMEFIPNWETLKKMKTDNIKFNSVEESIDNNDDFTKYNIKYFPTLVLQFEGKTDFNTYQGDRSVKDIVKFVRLNGINLNTTILEGFVNENNKANNEEPTGFSCGNYKKFIFEKGIFKYDKKKNIYTLEMEDYKREISGDLEYINPVYFLISKFIDKLREKNMTDNEIAMELNKCGVKMFIKNLDYGLCYNNSINELKKEYENSKEDLDKLEMIEKKVCNDDNYLVFSQFDPTTIGS